VSDPGEEFLLGNAAEDKIWMDQEVKYDYQSVDGRGEYARSNILYITP
jgi:hypothetical protein